MFSLHTDKVCTFLKAYCVLFVLNNNTCTPFFTSCCLPFWAVSFYYAKAVVWEPLFVCVPSGPLTETTQPYNNQQMCPFLKVVQGWVFTLQRTSQAVQVERHLKSIGPTHSFLQKKTRPREEKSDLPKVT